MQEVWQMLKSPSRSQNWAAVQENDEGDDISPLCPCKKGEAIRGSTDSNYTVFPTGENYYPYNDFFF